MDSGAWQATVQGVTNSQIQLSNYCYYCYPQLNNPVLYLVCLIFPFITMATHNSLKNYFPLLPDLISH